MRFFILIDDRQAVNVIDDRKSGQYSPLPVIFGWAAAIIGWVNSGSCFKWE